MGHLFENETSYQTITKHDTLVLLSSKLNFSLVKVILYIVWHKGKSIEHPIKIELTTYVLLHWLANNYTIKSDSKLRKELDNRLAKASSAFG